MQTFNISLVNKALNVAMKDEFLWQELLKEHSSFIEFVVAAAPGTFETAAGGIESNAATSASTAEGAAAHPPPAPPTLAKQSSGATADRQGNNESGVVTVPAPVPGTPPGAGGWGSWSARRAYRHILAARKARVVSWVAPHDALLAFPGARIPRPCSMGEHKVLCTHAAGNDELLGDAPAAREGSAMASLLGRYSITFGGWAVGSPVMRNDVHVRCLMEPWACDPDTYCDTLCTAVRKLHRIKPERENPWSIMIASPPRVYDGWVGGTTAGEFKEYLTRHAARAQQAKRATGPTTSAGAKGIPSPEALGYTGGDLDAEDDPRQSDGAGGGRLQQGWGGWESGVAPQPGYPHGSAVLVRGQTPRSRYGHTLTNVTLPFVPGSDPEAEAEAAAAAAGAGAGAGAGAAPASAKSSPRTREALVMVGGLLQGGYSGETDDIWCLVVEREELTPLDGPMLDKVRSGERSLLKHHIFDRRRLAATTGEHAYRDYDRYEEDEWAVDEEDEAAKAALQATGELPDQFLSREWAQTGSVQAFAQVVTPYRLHLRWHRIQIQSTPPRLSTDPQGTDAVSSLQARGYHSSAFDGDEGFLYVFGGFSEGENTESLQRIRVGMPDSPWAVQNVLGTGAGPCARFGAAMHVMGSKGGKKRLWVVGGGHGADLMRDGFEIRDLHALNLGTLTWERVQWASSVPQALPLTASVAVRPTEGEEHDEGDFPALATEAVSVLPPPAWLGRCLTSVALDDDRILVFGGCAESVRNMAVIKCDAHPPPAPAASAQAAADAAAPAAAAPEATQGSVFFDWYTPVQVMPHSTAFPSPEGPRPFKRPQPAAGVRSSAERSQPFFNCNDEALEAVKGVWAKHTFKDGQPTALVRAPLYANPFAMPRIQSARATRVGRHVHVFGGWTNTQTHWEGMLLLAPDEGRLGGAAPVLQPAAKSADRYPVDADELLSTAAPLADEVDPQALSAQMKDALVQAEQHASMCWPSNDAQHIGEVLLGSACGQPLGVWPPGRLAGPADSQWVLSAKNMHSGCVMEERCPYWLDGGRTGQRTREALLQLEAFGPMPSHGAD